MNNTIEQTLMIREIEQVIKNWEAQTSANLGDVLSKNKCNDNDINSAVAVVSILGDSLLQHVRAHLMLKAKSPEGDSSWN